MVLQEVRISKKLSQIDLAKLAHTTQATISYLEGGQRYPSAKVKSNIEKVLGINSVDWIKTRLQGDNKVNLNEIKAEEKIYKAVFNFIKTSITPEERKSKKNYLKQIIKSI